MAQKRIFYRGEVFIVLSYTDGSQYRLDEERVPKLILLFALPAMAGMIAGAVYNIVDRIFVGRYVGTLGLAAITVCFPAMLVFFAFSLLISTGGASRVAILRGAGDTQSAEEALGGAVGLFLFVGVLGILARFAGFGVFIKFSGGRGELLEPARAYLGIVLLGAPLAMVGQGLNPLIRSCGSPKYAMFSQIVGAGANVALDALFIVKMGMGVEGAALGTVAAQGCASAFGLAFFFSGRSPLRLRPSFIFRPKPVILGKILAIGASPFSTEMSFVFFMTIMNNLVRKYGGDLGLTAMGIFSSIDSLLFLPAMAVAEAIQPLVGYNYGAGKPLRVIDTVKQGTALVICFYAVSFLTAMFFIGDLIRLFNSDPELVALGAPGMRIGYAGILFIGVVLVANAALQGLGMARDAMILTLCRHVFFMYAPLFILPRFWGFIGVWMSFPVSDIFGGLLAVFFLRKLFRWLRSPEALESRRFSAR